MNEINIMNRRGKRKATDKEKQKGEADGRE